MTVWTAHRYAVVDVEGNGHQPPDLVELAIVPIEDGRIGDPAAWLVQQHQPITPIARRIHGITNAMVADAPRFSDVEAAVRAHLDGVVLIAHNAGVDLGVLRRKMPDLAPTAVLDTLRLARRLLPDQPSHRLGALAEALHLVDGLPPGLVPHRASYDALVAARLFVYLATKPDGTPRSFAALHNEARDGDETLF
jgi:DNA polymerase III epsilon subunit-like protein